MQKRAGRMSQVVKHLPSKCKTLSSNPSIAGKRGREKERKERERERERERQERERERKKKRGSQQGKSNREKAIGDKIRKYSGVRN
jgi:hypothetical protein